MARRISDSQLRQYLEKIGQSDLIDWLMKRSQEDEKLRAALLDWAAPRKDAKALATEIRARIRQAWQLSTRRDGWKMALPIARELDEVLASIRSLMDKGGLEEAQKLLAAFVQAAEKGMAHIDDSYGHLWPTCQRGVTVWGEAWARLEPRDAGKLVTLVYDHIYDNGYAIKDDMISKFAKALGTEGLHLLQGRLKEDLAALPRPAPGERLPDIARTQVVGWLKEIADALGDLDEYIAVTESEQQIEIYALPVARRLFEAGRLEEALAYLAKGTAKFIMGEPYDHPTLKGMILIALGRTDEAREILWREFTGSLSTSTLERILELTPEEQQDQAHEKAIALAESYRFPDQGAHFLIEANELDRAARLVQQRQDEISGSAYETLLKVADALAPAYPSQAWTLYRILLLDSLDESRYTAYSHAADYLLRMEHLAAAAGIQSQQAEFVQALRQAHGRKSSFWARVETDSR